jgi:hypothetical protein
MKTSFKIIYLVIATLSLILSGCATDDGYRDEKEYSDMPWNTPQQWEGSRSIPGMGGGGGGQGY